MTMRKVTFQSRGPGDVSLVDEESGQDICKLLPVISIEMMPITRRTHFPIIQCKISLRAFEVRGARLALTSSRGRIMKLTFEDGSELAVLTPEELGAGGRA